MPEDTRIATIRGIVQSIDEQLGLISGDEDQLRSDCAHLARLIPLPPSHQHLNYLKKLGQLLAHADDVKALPVYEYLAGVVMELEEPWTLLKPLLGAADEYVLQLATELTLHFVEKGRLKLSQGVLGELARLMDLEYSPFEDEDLLALLIRTMQLHYRPGEVTPLVDLLRKDADSLIRKFAARLLDQEGELVNAGTAQTILGKKAFEVLAPYLNYTRATYCDVFDLCGGKRVSKTVVEKFARAGVEHGEILVREAVATFGWSRVSLGIRIEHLVEVIVEGNLPLLVYPDESLLFKDSKATIGNSKFLITAHGGAAAKQKKDRKKSDPVDRFRQLNITHAELLGDILDVAPLDKPKVSRIIHFIDEVVRDYTALFSDSNDECSILPDVWRDLRNQVEQYLPREPDQGPLSAQLTRLILAFEDPENLGEVRTVHGLKRYLHQKGLKMGFEMVDTAHAPNRTVDLLLVGKDGHQARSRTIRYAEFEGGAEKSPEPWLPYPVKVVADGFSRQLLYGTENFPNVDVFIFGNEVHYYITFRNHPAFLRVDFSPPQRGGMLDLEYYGVSNYETDMHPNLDLDAIRLLFRKLQFDVKMEGTRLFVRYDKERSNSLADLCDHVEALFRLAPFLMDYDWTIGSLQLSAQAQEVVAGHWSDRFCQSGVLPLAGILNKNRTGVLIEYADGPTGKEEVLWDGSASYADRFSQGTPKGFRNQLSLALDNLWLSSPGLTEKAQGMPLHLLALEESVLNPLREAFRFGQVERDGENLQPVHPDFFQRVHEAEYFAALLAGEDEAVAGAALLARPLSELERFVGFTPTGFVGGLVVERARIRVHGGDITVYAARDSHGVIRLGVFTTDSRLVLSRQSKKQQWRSNARLDAGVLWELMRSANYLASSPPACVMDLTRDLADLRNLAGLRRPAANHRPMDDERILKGLKAAPGRAVGRAVFGTTGRKPEDLQDAILVAREVRPTDNQYLFKSAGIISTGGAVLSHASLLAIQFGKPAIVANADWDESGHALSLNFAVTVFREIERIVEGFSVCVRAEVRKRTDELVENDLVILDADEGLVQILGQHRDTLALWDGLHLLGEATRKSMSARGDNAVLEVRAQQLRARHQIQKILDRHTDPVLTAFAVEEIVVGESLAPVKHTDKKRLLLRVLDNAQVAETARAKLQEISLQLADRCRSAEKRAVEIIPTSGFLYEVLGLRLRATHWHEVLESALGLLNQCGLGSKVPVCDCRADLTILARERLIVLRLEMLRKLSDGGPRVRHLIRSIGRLSLVLGTPVPDPDLILEAQEILAAADYKRLSESNQKVVLTAADCGLESHSQIGWKAANLAEIDRLAGPETVPPWFVVSNHAFCRMKNQPIRSAEYLNMGIHTLGEAIRYILQQEGVDNKSKSRAIRSLWENMTIPEDLFRDVTASYASISVGAEEDSFVAVRSSSCDEDTEKIMRAGEFETYLYVLGVDSLHNYLLLTWAGLWTERALYSRDFAGTILQWPRCGVIVQRMVQSRASGVLQTVNVARGEMGEMLVNVGLGLGEGIVSGLVSADLVTVVKDFAPGADPVHINYLTDDKPFQMVFDNRRGRGTCLQETLYHQRLRPALEYTELCEIVKKASVLEEAYGYPLDIEFALEDTRLWLLQARPIATFSEEFRETLEKYPIAGAGKIHQNQEL